jgi:hypothetical protein
MSDSELAKTENRKTQDSCNIEMEEIKPEAVATQDEEELEALEKGRITIKPKKKKKKKRAGTLRKSYPSRCMLVG